MKKLLHVFMFASFCVLISMSTNAQEKITGGNMEDASKWTVTWRSDGADVGTVSFNYVDDGPEVGAGGCLSISSFGQTGVHVFQKVTLTPGKQYTLTGAFKNSSAQDIIESWAELILAKREPGTTDFTAQNGEYIFGMDSWNYADFNVTGFDATFQEDFPFRWELGTTDTILTSSTIVLPDTTTITEWYVVIKAGRWNPTAGVADASFNFLFDEISLVESGSVGVDENSVNVFDVYPNPSNGIVNIQSESNNVAFEVYNNGGMLVRSGILNGSKTIDLSDLKKGLYFINITSDLKNETHKFILK